MLMCRSFFKKLTQAVVLQSCDDNGSANSKSRAAGTEATHSRRFFPFSSAAFSSSDPVQT